LEFKTRRVVKQFIDEMVGYVLGVSDEELLILIHELLSNSPFNWIDELHHLRH